MNWEAIGAIGEIIGAIAVVGTLGFLAIQIRASTQQAKAAMTQDIVASFNGLHDAMMVSPQMSEVYAKKLAGETLSPVEEVQWESLINRAVNIYITVQRAYDGGQLDRDYFETCCSDVARMGGHSAWAKTSRDLLSKFPNESRLKIFSSLYSESGSRSEDA